jgi:hypothetical protein
VRLQYRFLERVQGEEPDRQSAAAVVGLGSGGEMEVQSTQPPRSWF